jgi:hypothetical protein
MEGVYSSSNKETIDTPINLHSIFRRLTGNNELLSTVIDDTKKKSEKKKSNMKSFDIMSSVVTEYASLFPGETQKYSSFPQCAKKFFNSDHVRFGIKNIMEKDLAPVNISFMNSLNVLLRPELVKNGNNNYVKDLTLLEELIRHRISRNYQIDRTVKNTKKVQESNNIIIKDMLDGKMTHNLIQYIVNIFEFNLLVFDFVTGDITLYWAYGAKYPYLNVFKELFSMAYGRGNYDPILVLNEDVVNSKKYHAHIDTMYSHILTDDSIKPNKPISLSPQTILKISSWKISSDIFMQIVEQYFTEKTDSSDSSESDD